jgi:hypothetical protein
MFLKISQIIEQNGMCPESMVALNWQEKPSHRFFYERVEYSTEQSQPFTISPPFG